MTPRELREGVERDIERLYRESAPQLWRSIYGFAGGRRHLAEDAVAEAFARAIERVNEIRDPLAWIYRTAFRIASRELQQGATRATAIAGPGPGHRPGGRAGRPLGAVDPVAEPAGGRGPPRPGGVHRPGGRAVDRHLGGDVLRVEGNPVVAAETATHWVLAAGQHAAGAVVNGRHSPLA